MKINQFKLDLMYTEKAISAQRIIDFILGRATSKALLLEEFQVHNDEMLSFVPADYAMATYKRYTYTRTHVQNSIKYNTTEITSNCVNLTTILSAALNCILRPSGNVNTLCRLLFFLPISQPSRSMAT